MEEFRLSRGMSLDELKYISLLFVYLIYLLFVFEEY